MDILHAIAETICARVIFDILCNRVCQTAARRYVSHKRVNRTDAPFLTALKDAFLELTGVLNILTGEQQAEIPEEVQKLVEERTAARAAKNFARADEIRDQLAAMGVILEDGKDGVKVLMKQ